MSYEPHYISSFEDESGLNQYYEPFLIPEKAFPTLEDAFCWRGKIKRRQGFVNLGRLRREFTLSSIGNSGNSPWSFNIYALLTPTITGEPNHEIETTPFAVPDPLAVRLVIRIGAIVFTDQGDGTLTSPTAGNSGIINYLTGAVTLTTTAPAGTASTITFAYFPGLPVMGLPNNLTNAINDTDLRAFDTKYAYKFNGTNFLELPSVAPTRWKGTDYDFFWTLTYWAMTAGSTKLMWVTNFNQTSSAIYDPLRYYDGTTWTDFTPAVDAVNTMWTCECLVVYKDRLLAFNTWEGKTVDNQSHAENYPQRLRYSQIGSPITATAWRSDTPGLGGFIDVPSDQQIISVEFIKDVLIVKLERSSWKIVYTGNKVTPFYFEKINTELGAESTFSLVPFDRGVYSVGNVGICTDDSVNVMRIDQQIPQVVFNIRNSENGPERVHGIRDFSNQLVYWAFPNYDEDHKFPNKVLLYNYVNSTYAIFNDSFTCYGYYQNATNLTWADYTTTSWEKANFTWNSGASQSLYPDIVAGNQQGFVSVLNQSTVNEFSLAINNITTEAITDKVIITSTEHNLEDGSFIYISNILASGSPDYATLNDAMYMISVIDNNNFYLQAYDIGSDTFPFVTMLPGGTYLGMGRIAYINNIKIITKVFSPFYEDGSQVRVGYLDFFLDKTTFGELTCNVFINESQVTSISDSFNVDNEGLFGTNVVMTSPENPTLLPFQVIQNKIWHRMFVQAIAQNFQLQFSMSPREMADTNVNSSNIVMHAMTIYLSKNARLTP